jgi:formate dehydrogenase iron-sulfur subunit
MKIAMLNDVTKCMACRGCQTACKQWNQLPAQETKFTGSYENPPSLSPITWTRIMFREHMDEGKARWLFAKMHCMHCQDAPCVDVCPSGAMHKTAKGTVKVDAEKCIACNYCVANCPFLVAQYDKSLGVARKCTFCYDRVENGMKPACAATCPTDSIVYGERNEILRMAEQRVAALKAKGVSKARIYGRDEMGGMAMVYVLADCPSAYGLPDNPQPPVGATLWGNMFKPFRTLAIVGAVAVGFVINRRRAREQQPDRS